jgi:hypothetical protein
MTTKYHHNKSGIASPANTAEQTQPKNADTAAPTPKAAPVITSFGVLFAHITWFFVGPLALLLILFSIVNAGTGWATVLDVMFFVIVGLMVGCRWYDQRSGQSTLSHGEPSTWADCWKYMLWMPLVAVAAWIVANLIGNHFVTMWSG